MPDDKLPSINDWDDSKELPSVDDFLKEEVEEELPSVEDYIEEEEVKEEDIQIIDDADGNPFLEVTDVVKAPEWSELVRMVNDVRESIPDIPEVKYYDEELKQLAEHIEQVRENIPEVKDYDNEVESICEQISLLRTSVKDLPEVKYYDEQIDSIEDKIDLIQQEVTNLPEPKYYENDFVLIREEIQKVREDVVPDFTWIGKTFKEYELDITAIGDRVDTFNTKINYDIDALSESFDIKDFESRVKINEVKDNLQEVKDKITEELKDCSMKIWEHQRLFKDDDRKLKKNILSKLNETRQNIEKKINESSNKYYESNKELKSYFEGLKEEISNLPEVKYYDDNIHDIEKNVSSLSSKFESEYRTTSRSISDLSKLVETIKLSQKQLKEQQETFDETDYATVGDLEKNYKVFVNRVQQQLSAIGGGGIEDAPSDDNEYVRKNQAWVANSGGGGGTGVGGTWASNAVGVHTTRNVGIATTARSEYNLYVGSGTTTDTVAYFDGHISVAGSIFSREVVEIDSIGIVTAGKGVRVSTGGLVVTAGVATVGTAITMGGGTVTATNFVGSGSGLTGVASTDYIITGTAATFNNQVNILNVSVSGASTVTGDLTVGGDLNVTGDLSYDEVTGRNINITGISTFGSSSGVGTVHIGVGTTALLVDGDARITGILTVGSSSITIDGINNTITVGDEDVTITNSQITIGSGVTISASASGINSAPNVLYVAKDGGDGNNGTSIDNAFLTIKAAVGAAQSGTTVKVLSGKYTEDNPISVPAFVSIVGDDQRAVEVTPSTTTSDLFHVRKAVKLANMTFKGHLAPAAAVAFPTDEIAENVGGGKWKGPYIQNCTSDTTTGTGVYVDGDRARLLRSMNVDAFTQYNQGGIGVAVTNGGFAQLVSLFTICTDQAVRVDKGGQADIANSNCSFGTKGLVAKGVSDLQYTGFVTTAAAVSQDEVIVNVDTFAPEKTINNFVYDNKIGVATVTTTAAHNFLVGMGVTLAGIGLTCEFGSKIYPHKRPYIFTVDSIPSTTSFVVNVGISTLTHTYVGSGSSAGTAKIDVDRPYDGQMVYFDQLYKEVKTIAVSAGGTGYTSTPAVTVEAPSGPNGETATAFATVEDEAIKSVTIISSGSQYTGTPDVTIAAPNVGINTATATASMDPLYYVINSSTAVSSGITTLTLATNLFNTVGVGSTAYFQQQSKIIASSHTFEYVGAGNLITEATPKRGGVLDQKNEVITEDGGKVLYTSTDQAGNFRIGDDLQIDQETGTISGRSFSKSLFSEMTPFILALS